MLTSSLPHGVFILILYFEGCLGINFASVQSGNFIFCLLSFCADKGFRCSKEEEVKNQSAVLLPFLVS
jgi:hypothetical protein